MSERGKERQGDAVRYREVALCCRVTEKGVRGRAVERYREAARDV